MEPSRAAIGEFITDEERKRRQPSCREGALSMGAFDEIIRARLTKLSAFH